jgi:hypothetical protein
VNPDPAGGERRARAFPLGNPLLAHDLAILIAGLKAARWHDLLALVTVAAVLALMLREAIWSIEPSMRLLASLGAALLAFGSLHTALSARLAYFVADSPLSPAALVRRNARIYRILAHALVSAAAAAVLCLPDIRAAALLILAWWSAFAALLFAERIGAWAVLSRLATGLAPGLDWRYAQVAGAGSVPVTALAAAIVFACAWFPETESAAVITVAVTAGALLCYAPVDWGIVNFERISGYSPLRSVSARLRRAGVMAIILSISAALSLNLDALGLVVATGAAILCYKVLAILLSRFLRARQVEFVMVALLFGFLASAFALPWAAPLLLIAAGAWLLRQAGRTTWQLQ